MNGNEAMQLKPVPVAPNMPTQAPTAGEAIVYDFGAERRAFADGMAGLRKPFPRECYGKLPKGGASLDYVGHAAVTDRLLSIDPTGNWEPLAFDAAGLPAFSRDTNGKPIGLWIRLTILGVTRLGFGTVMPNAFDAEKPLIGDALRNAAMRCGGALDLWSKDELESELPPKAGGKPIPAPTARPTAAQAAAAAPKTSPPPARAQAAPAAPGEELAPLPPRGDPQANAPIGAEVSIWEVREHGTDEVRAFQFDLPAIDEWFEQEIGGRSAVLKSRRWSELFGGDPALVDVARRQVSKSWLTVQAGGTLSDAEKMLIRCLSNVDFPEGEPFDWATGSTDGAKAVTT